ncbi:hypothetical protein [Demequina pelophila]|uniref:hypothetical protein n=1 Tax=Demequina pelophila TaxID=1638984 RepID=UPI000A72C51E|nr:hypothetical protein [Demequina pelophila]
MPEQPQDKPSIWNHTPDPGEGYEDEVDDDPGEAGSPVDIPAEVVIPRKAE